MPPVPPPLDPPLPIYIYLLHMTNPNGNRKSSLCVKIDLSALNGRRITFL